MYTVDDVITFTGASRAQPTLKATLSNVEYALGKAASGDQAHATHVLELLSRDSVTQANLDKLLKYETDPQLLAVDLTTRMSDPAKLKVLLKKVRMPVAGGARPDED